MATKLICPDCGGTVGELSHTRDTPCTCLSRPDEDQAFRRAATASADREQSNDAPTAGESAKVCRVCGTDVTGRKRYKDTLGYWCVDCHKDEKQQRAAGQAKCTSCGRMFAEEKLTETGVDRLCTACNRERIAKQRQFLRQAEKSKIHSEHNKKQLLVWLAVATGLVLLILLSRMNLL